jgi:hypothetical protein
LRKAAEPQQLVYSESPNLFNDDRQQTVQNNQPQHEPAISHKCPTAGGRSSVLVFDLGLILTNTEPAFVTRSKLVFFRHRAGLRDYRVTKMANGVQRRQIAGLWNRVLGLTVGASSAPAGMLIGNRHDRPATITSRLDGHQSPGLNSLLSL